MDTPPIVLELPLRLDESGTWRVGKTRVIIEMVIYEFNQGATPEQIVEAFDSLNLADVYHVIGYYINHREEIDAYIAKREAEAEEYRRQWEAKHPPVTKEDMIRRYEERTGKPFIPYTRHLTVFDLMEMPIDERQRTVEQAFERASHESFEEFEAYDDMDFNDDAF
ncbi:MAG: DUF433 domain-containing protein [bacterium]|nr:DUF433 domain-containing protein [bacterium]